MKEKNKKAQNTPLNRIFTIIGIILCVILVPVLIVNTTLIVKSYISDDVPSFFGIVPQIVLTDSMANPDEPNALYGGDLILCQKVSADDVKVGDTISFFDPSGNGSAVVTHSVVRIEDGKWITKGSANNAEDKKGVPFENLVGKYTGIRFAGLGRISMFMQTTTGLIVCVLIPLVLLVGYDIIRRKIYENKNNSDRDQLMAELEALRAEKAKSEETDSK